MRIKNFLKYEVFGLFIILTIFLSNNNANFFYAYADEQQHNPEDIIGHVYSTDIVAYIDDMPIPSYNIGGKTVVSENDLVNYGFNITWDPIHRNLTIEADRKPNKAPNVIIRKNKPGQILGNVYYTDIVILFNDFEVEAYNTGGEILISLEDLVKKIESDRVYRKIENNLQILALFNVNCLSDLNSVDENLIEFAINYNFAYKREETTIDDLYMKKESIIDTIFQFFNIDKHVISNDLEKFDFINYKDMYCYKVNPHIYEHHFNNIETHINKIVKLENDSSVIYSTSYIIFPDGKEYIFNNIKSLVSEDYKISKYEKMELYK